MLKSKNKLFSWLCTIFSMVVWSEKRGFQKQEKHRFPGIRRNHKIFVEPFSKSYLPESVFLAMDIK